MKRVLAMGQSLDDPMPVLNWGITNLGTSNG
jgi:hypothetical protein